MPNTKSFGYMKGGISGHYAPMANDNYYYFAGGAFVYLDSNGYAELCINTTQAVYGWAMAPKSNGASSALSYWSTGGTDAVFNCYIITDLSAIFSIPTSGNTYAITYNGECCDVSNANATTIQAANLGTHSHDILITTGGDVTNDIAYVRMNPNEMQMDT